ncbi:ectoine/hydroxyectoine ABC transporter substrate-binding protein EhuB [Salinisphaera sp.]|uniref:ectoine/hydroxyectoine ABC transporter substrate-binding protein EhuB n=1 Tax=Salinisphaera sp. TaxID=1914330 RepID=UPI002D7940E6|nr:ectoine/hydroxyectoine ABC transporter substrate-binding protein EhuB [Salinisphaera sp.]HET7312982.1 ectoine/hydroxyectoine ABC transporter substrate-binding protein EhuB [Salinisphaera sp.]
MSRSRPLTRFVHALVLLALTVVVSAAASAASLQDIKDRGYIRIAVANEIPYGFMNAQGKAEGFGPSTAKMVLKRMGIDDIQWTVVPFGSLIPALKAGRVDMVAASQAVLPQRCSQVDFSIPNTTYGEGLMVKKGNPKDIHGYQDFVKNDDLKMGIVSGADQLEFAHKLGIPDSQLVMLRANTDAASAVASGRVDAYAGTQLTVARLAKKSDRTIEAEPFNDPVINGEPVRSWGAFTFNSDSDKLRKAFNKNLKAVQQTKEWKQTLKHYGLDEHSIDLVDAKTTEQLCSASSD